MVQNLSSEPAIIGFELGGSVNLIRSTALVLTIVFKRGGTGLDHYWMIIYVHIYSQRWRASISQTKHRGFRDMTAKKWAKDVSFQYTNPIF